MTERPIDLSRYRGHTPPPWDVTYSSDCVGAYQIDSPGVDIATCDEATEQANIMLIADAPLLVAEVEQLRHDASNAKILRDALTLAQSHAASLAVALGDILPPNDYAWTKGNQFICDYCGRDNYETENDPCPQFCPSDDCPATVARAALSAWRDAQGAGGGDDGC